AKSWSKLRECFGCKWRPRAYFADKWQASAPDRAALDPGFKLGAGFDALDRSAVYGAYIHRDLIWIENFGAAFAVFFAVTGQVTHGHGGAGWGVAELVTLLWVAMLVLVARRAHLQDRWTACRLGAEQLRIARMTLPLLVLPQALATSDKPPAEDERSSQEAKFGNEALAYVKRVVRDQGLPRFDPSFAPSQAIAWVRLIVRDQITYHNTNHRKLECAESRLRHVTQLIFVAAVLAVVAHFCWHDDRLLLLTAAAPAFAAAAHATLTRLGIVHRAALSIDTERELKEIDEALDRVRPDSMNIEAWTEVRRLAFKAGDAMGRENTTWHGLVRRYRDEV
ncbi:MAG TPA: hypothetical protein VEK73_05810, partial [Xanthobacteraceae bacterium]|nr:hypothetical protein [Xanthobacteraceae bacterium]